MCFGTVRLAKLQPMKHSFGIAVMLGVNLNSLKLEQYLKQASPNVFTESGSSTLDTPVDEKAASPIDVTDAGIQPMSIKLAQFLNARSPM